MDMLYSAIVPALPVEIIQEVIDQVASESPIVLKIPVLRQCSVVSKTWRNCVLKHFFRRVILSSDSKICSLARVLQANMSLVSHIRVAIMILTPVSPAMLSLPQLVNVTTLTIIMELCSESNALLLDCIKWLATTFTHISSLTVLGSADCSKRNMPMRLLLAFPHLRHLDLDLGCDVLESCNIPRAELSGACKVRAMKLEGEHRALLRWLASTNMAGTLEDFEWHQYSPYPVNVQGSEALSTLFNAATSLQNVQLVTLSAHDMAILLQCITARGAFSNNPSLRTLSLTIWCDSPTATAFLSVVRALCIVRQHSIHLDTSIVLSCSLPDKNLLQYIPDALMSRSAGDKADLILRLGLECTLTIMSLAGLESVLRTVVQT